jgi:hypothetical protein
MWKSLGTLVVLLVVPSVASASWLRVDLTKSNRATSPIKYELQTTTSSGLVIVHLDVPSKQRPLEHLWQIHLVLRSETDKNTTIVSAPLALTHDGELMKTEFIIDPGTMSRAEIWIRTGEHAPLSETVYAIDVGSFK